MNKKGFVLMETIVVIVVISVALLTIFSSYNKILRKVKTENKYDTSEYVYMTNYIKKNLPTGLTVTDLLPVCAENLSCDEFTVDNYLVLLTGMNNTIKNFNVKGIYLLTNINKFDKKIKSDGTKNSEYFDSYMIDYIRKLDVGDTDTLLIVEYKRPSVDGNYTTKKMYYNNTSKELSETYIASLEW